MMIEPGRLAVEDLLLVGHDVLADLHAGQHPDGGAGGEDQVVERVAMRAVRRRPRRRWRT